MTGDFATTFTNREVKASRRNIAMRTIGLFAAR